MILDIFFWLSITCFYIFMTGASLPVLVKTIEGIWAPITMENLKNDPLGDNTNQFFIMALCWPITVPCMFIALIINYLVKTFYYLGINTSEGVQELIETGTEKALYFLEEAKKPKQVKAPEEPNNMEHHEKELREFDRKLLKTEEKYFER